MAYDTLHDRLRGPIAKNLSSTLKQKNVHALPQLEKVVVNVGINKSKMDSKEMQAYIEESLMKITGQKPVFTKAKKAISNFKTREGMTVGCMVTLRGKNMEEFLDRLLSYSLPRVRDFRGLPSKLDGHGNYSIGIKDHSIFPEVPAPDAKQIFGLQVVISTTAENDEQAMALFQEIGMPFRRDDKKEEEEAKKAEAAKAEKEAAEAEAKGESEDADESEDEEKKKDGESVESEDKSDDTAETSDSDSEPQSQS